MLPTSPTIIVVDVTVDSAASIVNKDASGQCLRQELLKFFRELSAKERSYPSTAKNWRMYIKCAYYMPEHVAVIYTTIGDACVCTI